MCDTCRPVLGKWARAHPRTPCPVAKALYCTTCAVYGHGPKRCPAAALRAERGAPDLAAADTLYPVGAAQPFMEHAWVVEDDEECIKSALVINGGTPMICQEKGKREMKEYRENKRRLVELAKENGQILVLKDGSATGKEKRT